MQTNQIPVGSMARGGALAALLLVVPLTAQAIPILSLDVDPATAGIQSTRDVFVGDSFAVDLMIEDVTDLAGFAFDLSFDPLILRPDDVADGGFIISPLIVRQILDLDVGLIQFDEAGTGGSSAAAGVARVLATMQFTALAAGISDLEFPVGPPATVLLAGGFLGDIPDFSLSQAAIQVVNRPGGTPVPEGDLAGWWVGILMVVLLRERRAWRTRSG